MQLDYITAKGGILALIGNPLFKFYDAQGLTTAHVNISTSSVSSMDGAFVNNMQTDPRSIVIDLAIERDVEKTKREITKYIKPKQTCYLRFTQNDRTIQIEGVVESIEMPRTSNFTIMQITIFCGQPYWEDLEYIVQEISEVVNMHYFTDDENDMLYFPEEGIVMGEYDLNRTKVFVNEGDIDVGMEIRIIALGNVVNPKIQNSNGQFFGVKTTLQANDEIIITTGKGEKAVTLNGENIIDRVMIGVTWLQLEVGENEFTIDSDEDTESMMYFNVAYKQRYV